MLLDSWKKSIVREPFLRSRLKHETQSRTITESRAKGIRPAEDGRDVRACGMSGKDDDSAGGRTTSFPDPRALANFVGGRVSVRGVEGTVVAADPISGR